jgi:uncharacterized DUF497 family protein
MHISLAVFRTRFNAIALASASGAISQRNLLWHTFYTMGFEYDERKNRAKLKKHGIDFVEAQRLWDDEQLLEITARTEDEPRSIVIGRIDDKHWAAIVTHREDRTRIISVRRARKEEQALYES